MNSRSKDIYDLVFFLPKTTDKILVKAIKECFKFRETDLPKNFVKILENLDTTRLKRGWSAASASIPKAPSFVESYRQLIELLRVKNL